MAVYNISDFSRGMLRDASLVGEKPVLRTVKNYRYDYDGDLVKLQVRKGYDNFNANVLANPPQQLFVYRDLENNEHLLGIIHTGTPLNEYRWYDINESTASAPISDEEATPRKHINNVGGRVFFGTDGTGADIGWRWADNASIIGANGSYRVGIKKPTDVPVITNTDAIVGQFEYGHTAVPLGGYSNLLLILGRVEQRYIYAKVILTEEAIIGNVRIRMCRANAETILGNLRVSIYTNSGGFPTANLVDDNAISNWVPVVSLNAFSTDPALDYGYVTFTLADKITLSPGSYWIRLQSDGAYRDAFDITSGVGDQRFVCIDKRNIVIVPAKYSYSLYSPDAASFTVAGVEHGGYEMQFYLGGLTTNYYYDYVITYYNETYGIESRPSDNIRIKYTDGYMFVLDSYSDPSDPQVDKIRLYRRTVGADSLILETAITDTYKLVGEVEYPDEIHDLLSEEHLGAELQTQDHYCFDDTDDSGEELRDAALVPFLVSAWKDRIWFSEENKNVMYFSKLLEEDGATGWTNKAIYDFVPLDNKLEMPVSSGIIGHKQMTDDQLAIYFRNGETWIIEGGNDIYNPPSDLARRQALTDTGLFAPYALGATKGRHIFMAQDGIYGFQGTSDPVYLSQEVQSIFDAINFTYLDDTIIACFGEEIWVLYDSDNDGYKDQILVLNIKRSTPTWRLYDYGRTFNDIVIRPTGNETRTVLAADALTGYVWELDNGTTDNGMPIETEIETHELRVAQRIMITGVELDGSYPNVPAKYQVIISDHTGNKSMYTIAPNSSDDIRGHRTGCRVLTGPTAKVSIQGLSVNEDKLLSLTIYTEER